MNLLSRFYNRLACRLVKWWDMPKWKRFLNSRELAVVVRVYDEMWKE